MKGKNKSLKFGEQTVEPNVRKLYNLKKVILDTKWLKSVDNFDIYYMYRGIYLTERDMETICKNDLRYDITIITKKNFGSEKAKTLGHFHALVPGMNISYPEIYQVLSGNATFLLQKHKNGKVDDVIIIDAAKGDIVVIPPNYGHITINNSNKPLKIADWMCASVSSYYNEIESKKGGAYYKLTDGRIIKNKNYEDVPEFRICKPIKKEQFGVKTIYELILDPSKLKFLIKPQDYPELFKYLEKEKN